MPTKTSTATTEREYIEHAILDIVGLRARGDMAGLMKYASPDIVFTGGSWRNYPLNAPRQGKDACADMANQVNIAFENLGSTINSLVVDGDRVAMQRTARIRNRGTGRTVSIEICNFLRFRDGLVIEFSEYPDTVAAAQLEAN